MCVCVTSSCLRGRYFTLFLFQLLCLSAATLFGLPCCPIFVNEILCSISPFCLVCVCVCVCVCVSVSSGAVRPRTQLDGGVMLQNSKLNFGNKRRLHIID